MKVFRSEIKVSLFLKGRVIGSKWSCKIMVPIKAPMSKHVERNFALSEKKRQRIIFYY